MSKWIAEFELEDGDTMPEHMDLEYRGARIDFHCKPLEQEPTTKNNLGVDCISRADARKAILDHQYSDSFCEEHNIDHSINTSMALIALSDLPSVTPQESRWIPVSERLPEKGYSVLVTRIIDDNCKYVRIASYQGDCWMDNTDEFNKPNPHKVIAWQSLSPCYEPQESEDT